MMLIESYQTPHSVEEAYQLLQENQSSVIVGGGAFLRLGSKEVKLAIDLCRADLDFINEKEETIEIGAMTTLRSIETSDLLKKYYGDFFAKTVAHIVAVQLRNIATIGGSVAGRFGFSDIITSLLAIDAKLVFHNGGEISIENFMENKKPKDILVKVILKKDKINASFQTMRNTQNDFPMLNVAAAKINDKLNISVGARPASAKLVKNAMEYINSNEITEESALEAGQKAAENLTFGDDVRASAEYREMLTPVLVKRAIMEVIG